MTITGTSFGTSPLVNLDSLPLQIVINTDTVIVANSRAVGLKNEEKLVVGRPHKVQREACTVAGGEILFIDRRTPGRPSRDSRL